MVVFCINCVYAYAKLLWYKFPSNSYQGCITVQYPTCPWLHRFYLVFLFIKCNNSTFDFITSACLIDPVTRKKKKNCVNFPYFPCRRKQFEIAWAHFEAQFEFQFIFSFVPCETCLRTAAHLTVTLSTVSSLISLSRCLYAFPCVEPAKQAHRLKPSIHSLQLLSWQPCMTDSKQTALSELQSTWMPQSMNTLLWADEELWNRDTREATVCEVGERGLRTGLVSIMFTFWRGGKGLLYCNFV